MRRRLRRRRWSIRNSKKHARASGRGSGSGSKNGSGSSRGGSSGSSSGSSNGITVAHDGRQQKQQRARQWILMVYIRETGAAAPSGAAMHGPAAEALLEGAEYDAEAEYAAEASEAAIVEQ